MKPPTVRYRDYEQLPDGLPCGPLNKITDVPGLAVGHHTLQQQEPTILNTGVTCLSIENVQSSQVAAATHIMNGFGKSLGLAQIDEIGTMESHVFLTNTLSVGAVQQGAVKIALKERPNIRSFNAVVMECNDGRLSDIAQLAVTPEMADLALRDATDDFPMGSVGAGTGMICFGYKGGIGSSSRLIEIDGKVYTVGSIVLSNFGRQDDLTLPGKGRLAPRPDAEGESGDGSLILVVATDVPLMPHQLKRVARHSCLSVGLLGGPGSHGSGDFALAFSTTMRTTPGSAIMERANLVNDGAAMSALFRAAAWSCAEAILDSMLLSPATKGFRTEVLSLADFVNH